MTNTEQKPQKLTLTSVPSGLRSGANLIASETQSVQKKFLAQLSEAELATLPYLFDFWALPHQVPPEGDWRTWVILGGRGAGKTRAGAEWVRSMVEGSFAVSKGEAQHIGVVAETMDQARDVMIFGESGIMAVCPPDRNRAFYRLTVLPLATRVLSSIADWLSDYDDDRIDLRPDLDQIPALSTERDAQWRRVSEASFLTDSEKRSMLGLPALEVGDGQ